LGRAAGLAAAGAAALRVTAGGPASLPGVCACALVRDTTCADGSFADGTFRLADPAPAAVAFMLDTSFNSPNARQTDDGRPHRREAPSPPLERLRWNGCARRNGCLRAPIGQPRGHDPRPRI
jgi:hypothetical protein